MCVSGSASVKGNGPLITVNAAVLPVIEGSLIVMLAMVICAPAVGLSRIISVTWPSQIVGAVVLSTVHTGSGFTVTTAVCVVELIQPLAATWNS